MLRRGYLDILPDSSVKPTLLQLRRRGYSVDSKQFLPLRIHIPPTTTLCDLDGRFENPRPAPLPQGLKYNTIQNPPIPPPPTQFFPEPITPPPFGTSHTDSANYGVEFHNLSQVSVFALPKFDPEKEMKTLQNLWSKRCSKDPPPLICRSPFPPQDIQDLHSTNEERSFFESDSDSEDEEVNPRRFALFLLYS